MPRIHSILLCKNEQDIIGPCILDALRWSDFIYVYDGLSDDHTWEVVNDIAKAHPQQVFPWKQDGKVFSEGLRAEVFHAFKHKAQHGDWWCQLNADEFFVDDPKAFLANVPNPRAVVWGLFAQFYVTREDLPAVESATAFEQITESLHFFEVIPTGEPRFFRHRNGLNWKLSDAWPHHLGFNHRDRIHLKHYPYRTPNQIKKRILTRNDNRQRGFEGWSYVGKDWSEKLLPRSDLFNDIDAPISTTLAQHPHPLPADKPLKRLFKWLCFTLKRWP